MQSPFYKIKIFCNLFKNYLHISKKSSIFAPKLKKTKHNHD